ncbi:hypothetical protein B0A55_03732 [Friedmanniomyces simplex]|uniref:Uncharacterized protein n=1 Tax=Friedmanniomyces simplex TaxID=329884 RepID=A0A4V5NJ36_9PEZI|nr:hypothetical protein B0A55_03732 [Friedmanniomyces simplex]
MTDDPERSLAPEYSTNARDPMQTLHQESDPSAVPHDLLSRSQIEALQQFIGMQQPNQQTRADDVSFFPSDMPTTSQVGHYSYLHLHSAAGDQVVGKMDGMVTPALILVMEGPKRKSTRRSLGEMAASDDGLTPPRRRRQVKHAHVPIVPTPSTSTGSSFGRNFTHPRQRKTQQMLSTPATIVQAMVTATSSVFTSNVTVSVTNQSTLTAPSGAAIMSPNTLILPHPVGNGAGGTTQGNPGKRMIKGGTMRIVGRTLAFKDAPDETVNLFRGWTGAVEIIELFPNHTTWPRVMLRLLGNNWTTKEIAAVQLFARDALDKDTLQRRYDAVRYQAIKPGKYLFPHVPGWTPTANPGDVPPVTNYDVTPFMPPPSKVSTLPSITLYEIGKDIVHFPSPEDSGPLTKAVQWAVRIGNTAYTTDDIPALAQAFGWTWPAEATTNDSDQDNANASSHSAFTYPATPTQMTDATDAYTFNGGVADDCDSAAPQHGFRASGGSAVHPHHPENQTSMYQHRPYPSWPPMTSSHFSNNTPGHFAHGNHAIRNFAVPVYGNKRQPANSSSAPTTHQSTDLLGLEINRYLSSRLADPYAYGYHTQRPQAQHAPPYPSRPFDVGPCANQYSDPGFMLNP